MWIYEAFYNGLIAAVSIGNQGSTGAKGPAGLQGPTGAHGATGPQGLRASNNSPQTFIVGSDGVELPLITIIDSYVSLYVTRDPTNHALVTYQVRNEQDYVNTYIGIAAGLRITYSGDRLIYASADCSGAPNVGIPYTASSIFELGDNILKLEKPMIASRLWHSVQIPVRVFRLVLQSLQTTRCITG